MNTPECRLTKLRNHIRSLDSESGDAETMTNALCMIGELKKHLRAIELAVDGYNQAPSAQALVSVFQRIKKHCREGLS